MPRLGRRLRRFQASVARKLEHQLAGTHRFELLGADRVAPKQARAELWEKKLRAIAHAAEVELGRLPGAKSAGEKVLLATIMKNVTSVSNRWLAERLVMGGPASVSSLVTRFQRNGGTENPVFLSLRSRFAS